MVAGIETRVALDFFGAGHRITQMKAKNNHTRQYFIMVSQDEGTKGAQYLVSNCDHFGNQYLSAWSVTYMDNLGRKELLGYAPTLTFARRICANHLRTLKPA